MIPAPRVTSSGDPVPKKKSTPSDNLLTSSWVAPSEPAVPAALVAKTPVLRPPPVNGSLSVPTVAPAAPSPVFPRQPTPEPTLTPTGLPAPNGLAAAPAKKNGVTASRFADDDYVARDFTKGSSATGWSDTVVSPVTTPATPRQPVITPTPTTETGSGNLTPTGTDTPPAKKTGMEASEFVDEEYVAKNSFPSGSMDNASASTRSSTVATPDPTEANDSGPKKTGMEASRFAYDGYVYRNPFASGTKKNTSAPVREDIVITPLPEPATTRHQETDAVAAAPPGAKTGVPALTEHNPPASKKPGVSASRFADDSYVPNDLDTPKPPGKAKSNKSTSASMYADDDYVPTNLSAPKPQPKPKPKSEKSISASKFANDSYVAKDLGQTEGRKASPWKKGYDPKDRKQGGKRKW